MNLNNENTEIGITQILNKTTKSSNTILNSTELRLVESV